jgi:cellulose synthase/poly-beta-1,6-N-acetylglucosamine synthase-like glycosyltransferase
MVAQGTFSLYDIATLKKVGGWPDCVGEDIVLSWSILNHGYHIGHCEDAMLFTNAPATPITLLNIGFLRIFLNRRGQQTLLTERSLAAAEERANLLSQHKAKL